VHGEQSTKRVGQIESVGPLIAEFGDERPNHSVNEPALTLGRLAPAESREALGEESFKVLGDCGVAVLGIDISQLDKPRVTETFDFCF
jgi:hypothetical protein